MKDPIQEKLNSIFIGWTKTKTDEELLKTIIDSDKYVDDVISMNRNEMLNRKQDRQMTAADHADFFRNI